MPKKKSGFPYEVHPTPAKGKDGRNIVYARPARGYKMSMKGVDEFCHKYYNTRDGEITYALEQFLKGAAELMARGYRIDTPIGSLTTLAFVSISLVSSLITVISCVYIIRMQN